MLCYAVLYYAVLFYGVVLCFACVMCMLCRVNRSKENNFFTPVKFFLSPNRAYFRAPFEVKYTGFSEYAVNVGLNLEYP
jgi:hypothetical protein